MELKKELLELEVEKQNGKIKLLEAENKNLDKIIYEEEKWCTPVLHITGLYVLRA